MVGISGVGKTTLADKLFSQHVKISLDKISNNRQIEYNIIEENLKINNDIVIDDTNLTRDIRSKHIILAKKYDVKVKAFFINVPMWKILYQNRNRKEPKHESILFKMKKQLEYPDEIEGFDFIQKID